MVNNSKDSPPFVSYQTLTRIQNTTGVVIAAFTALHVGNAATVWGGPFAYDQVQSALRVVYRGSSAVEWTLLGAIALHGGASMVKLARRNATLDKIARSKSTPFASKVHSFTGIFLLCSIGAHVFATRILPDWIVEADVDTGPIFGKSALVAHSMIGLRQLFMLPYYSLLLFSGSVHAFSGMRRIVGALRGRREVTVVDDALGKPTRRELFAYGGWFVLCALTALRFTNPAALQDVPISSLQEVDLLSYAGRKVTSFLSIFNSE